MVRTKTASLVALAVGATLALSACSSSGSGNGGSGKSSSSGASGTSSSSTGNSGNASGKTIEIGVIIDRTGAGAAATGTDDLGVKAYVNKVNAAGGINGDKLSYVVADSQSTPAGALSAAQSLVQRSHVFAVFADSVVIGAAVPYLHKQNIPVFGAGWDSNTWSNPANTNMFSAAGVNDSTKASSTSGKFLKAQGGTICASIGYDQGPGQLSAAASAKSCEAAGLKSGYVNAQLPLGSTDVGPLALAIKNAHVDALYMATTANTEFALLAALKQYGVKIKASLLDTGYGKELLASKPDLALAQGFNFLTPVKPVELNDAATKAMVAAFKTVGITGLPGNFQMEAYFGMTALGTGLKAAGPNPTQASLIAATRKITDFNGEGLLSPGSVNFSNFHQFGASGGFGGCIYAVQLQGSKFVPSKGTPVCGGAVAGTVGK